MISWYYSGLHCQWSQCHEYENQEIFEPVILFGPYRNPFVYSLEKAFAGYWFDKVRQPILSIVLGVHGYKSSINLHWVYRCILSIVTYPTRFYNYVRQIAHKIKQIEGHVPQGVEVQVLSSAQKQASRFRLIEICTDRGGVM